MFHFVEGFFGGPVVEDHVQEMLRDTGRHTEAVHPHEEMLFKLKGKDK